MRSTTCFPARDPTRSRAAPASTTRCTGTRGRGITANLSTRKATGDGTDRFTAIEGLGGSDYADTLIGNGSGNGLYSYDGNDKLFGKGGNDWMYGGTGRDYLDGGPGNDYGHGETGTDRCVNVERPHSCP